MKYKLLSNFVTCLTVLCLTSQTFANVPQVAQKNSTIKQQSLLSIVEEYDYKVSTSGNANDEEFKNVALTDLKTKLASKTMNSSTEELKTELKEVFSLIPSESKRSALEEKIKFSTKAELEKIITDPVSFSEALQGQGSNFIFDGSKDNLLVIVAVIVVAAAIISTVNYNSKHSAYYSYVLSYKIYFDSESCSAYDLTSYEREELKADALSQCHSRASNPNTCKLSGWDTSKSYDYDYYGEIRDGYCDIRAKAVAKK